MGTGVKRGAGVAMGAALVLATCLLGYGVSHATGRLGAEPPRSELVRPSPQSAPAPAPQQVLPSNQLEPIPALFREGDTGPQVRALQARLRQLAWYAGNVGDTYDAKTTAAVSGFQAKRGLPALGYVDVATMKRLRAMTHAPTKAELANRPTDGTWTDAPLDPRCRVGRVICVDKSSRTLRWVVDGDVRKTLAVRFGSAYTPTREGAFRITYKSRNHVSSLYDTSMPYAMFFSRGQAVHFSPDFAAVGYAGASHGCVNVRDRAGVAWLFDQVVVGDNVVVYWS